METLWYAEMLWLGKWIRVTEGHAKREDAEWEVARWKSLHSHKTDNFRYGFERVDTAVDENGKRIAYTELSS